MARGLDPTVCCKELNQGSATDVVSAVAVYPCSLPAKQSLSPQGYLP